MKFTLTASRGDELGTTFAALPCRRPKRAIDAEFEQKRGFILLQPQENATFFSSTFQREKDIVKFFFQGWKRAVQLATIILALVLIGGFMKYQTIEDTIMFRVLVPLNLLSMSLLLIK